MSKQRTESLGPWQKGINNSSRDYVLPKGACLDSLNVDFTAEGYPRSRTGVTRFFGNASQVFSSALSGAGYTTSCLGIPIAGGVGGTNAFGNDGLYDYRPNDMCALSGGGSANGSAAGVWALSLSNARSSSSAYVGFRAAIYPTT